MGSFLFLKIAKIFKSYDKLTSMESFITLALDALTATLYVVLFVMIWKTIQRQPSELSSAILAFALGMALFKILEIVAEVTEIPQFLALALSAAIIGDTFTLKLPLLWAPPAWRRPLFGAAFTVSLIVVGMLLFAMASAPAFAHGGDEGVELGTISIASGEQTTAFPINTLASSYLLLISGITGFYLLIQGIRSSATWMRMKSIGSGVGLAGCCIAIERSLVLFGAGVSGSAPIIAESIAVFAPLVIILAILYGRRVQGETLAS